MQGNVQQMPMISADDKKFLKLLQILERLDSSCEAIQRAEIIEQLREMV